MALDKIGAGFEGIPTWPEPWCFLEPPTTTCTFLGMESSCHEPITWDTPFAGGIHSGHIWCFFTLIALCFFSLTYVPLPWHWKDSMKVLTSFFAMWTGLIALIRIKLGISRLLCIFAAIHCLFKAAMVLHVSNEIKDFKMFTNGIRWAGLICSVICSFCFLWPDLFVAFLAQQLLGILLDVGMPLMFLGKTLFDKDPDVRHFYFRPALAHTIHLLFTVLPLILTSFHVGTNSWYASFFLELAFYISAPITHVVYISWAFDVDTMRTPITFRHSSFIQMGVEVEHIRKTICVMDDYDGNDDHDNTAITRSANTLATDISASTIATPVPASPPATPTTPTTKRDRVSVGQKLRDLAGSTKKDKKESLPPTNGNGHNEEWIEQSQRSGSEVSTSKDLARGQEISKGRVSDADSFQKSKLLGRGQDNLDRRMSLVHGSRLIGGDSGDAKRYLSDSVIDEDSKRDQQKGLIPAKFRIKGTPKYLALGFILGIIFLAAYPFWILGGPCPKEQQKEFVCLAGTDGTASVHRTGILSVKRGRNEVFLERLSQSGFVLKGRRARGNLQYKIVKSTEERLEYLVVEEWKDWASLQAYYNSESYKFVMDGLRPTLVSGKMLDVNHYFSAGVEGVVDFCEIDSDSETTTTVTNENNGTATTE